LLAEEHEIGALEGTAKAPYFLRSVLVGFQYAKLIGTTVYNSLRAVTTKSRPREEAAR
jgi:hypothetical protein